MWIPRSILSNILEDLSALKKEMNEIKKTTAMETNTVAAKKINVTTLYGDNEIRQAELQICLSAHDWCLLQNQPQELIEFVCTLQTQ